MSINPISASQAAASAAAAAPTSSPLAGTVTAVVMSTEPVIVDTIPAIPPPDVLAAVQTASQSYDQLAASGRQVHFASDPQNGRLSIQVLDMAGTQLSTISPTTALHAASGDPATLKAIATTTKQTTPTTGSSAGGATTARTGAIGGGSR